MDFISHILLGFIFGELLQLKNINLVFLLIGSVLPDLSTFPILFYYRGKKGVYRNFLEDNRKKPNGLFAFYDFSHSLLLILIILGLSYFYFPLTFLALGIFFHILIDIPLHKKHSPGIFYPFKKRIGGITDWFEIYNSLKSRVIVWAILLIIFLIVKYLIIFF